jgi:hypothetical protein
MKKILFVLCLITNHALASDNPIKQFDVALITTSGFNVRAFNCESKDNELICNIRQTSANYYKWKSGDKEIEPKRCHLNTYSDKEIFTMKSLGVWAHRERGGICNALVEYVIKPTPNGIEYDEITLELGDSKNPFCVEVFGNSGTVEQYLPYQSLSRIPLSCSSIVVSP